MCCGLFVSLVAAEKSAKSDVRPIAALGLMARCSNGGCVFTVETFAHVQDAREIKLRSNFANPKLSGGRSEIGGKHTSQGRLTRRVVDDK